jgi:hypothetical protein
MKDIKFTSQAMDVLMEYEQLFSESLADCAEKIATESGDEEIQACHVRAAWDKLVDLQQLH